ncbi:hypothetical protein B0O80DRAFT_442925 [Mortierella sp. GBAus27b]|nr:hypothetical protein B0O80DRAFT_442925 [Mortierella sp. GBAus27b]
MALVLNVCIHAFYSFISICFDPMVLFGVASSKLVCDKVVRSFGTSGEYVGIPLFVCGALLLDVLGAFLGLSSSLSRYLGRRVKWT